MKTIIQSLILSCFILFSSFKANDTRVPLNSTTITKSLFKISSIELEHTNPSLGPYETITTVTLQNNSKTTKKIQEFLNLSKINQTCTIAEYLEAVLKSNKILIQKVYDNSPKNELNEGEQISNLIFHFEGGNSIELNDVYRRFNLSNFYGDFTKYMVANGSITKTNDTIESQEPLKD